MRSRHELRASCGLKWAGVGSQGRALCHELRASCGLKCLAAAARRLLRRWSRASRFVWIKMPSSLPPSSIPAGVTSFALRVD